MTTPISTYGELKTAVANWLERNDLTARIPDFIALSESRINQELRTRENEKRVTASISTEYFDIPSNFIEMRNFQLNTDPIQKLDYVSPEQIDAFNSHALAGRPYSYTIHGTEFQLKPVPDATYTAEMTYWYELAAFSVDADTNTSLQKFPGLYLYGALIEASPFLENDAKIATWKGLYDDLMAGINRRDKIGRYSGTKLFSKPRTRPE